MYNYKSQRRNTGNRIPSLAYLKTMPRIPKPTDNLIEWSRGDKRIFISTYDTSPFYKRLMKLQEKHEEVRLEAINDDSTVLLTVPLEWLSIKPKRKSPEKRAMAAQLYKKRKSKDEWRDILRQLSNDADERGDA